jgi:hypothetical protein
LWSVAEKRRDVATFCHASLSLFGELSSLFAILAANREG